MIIDPYKSVGNLFFDDSRIVIRQKLNEKFEAGVKEFDGSSEYYDYFLESQLFVYYDKTDKILAFEFFEPNPVFDGVNILSKSYKKLLEILKKLDKDLKVDYNGFTSYKYGIGANTNDDPEDNDAMPEAVIVFRLGYYDSLKEYIENLSK